MLMTASPASAYGASTATLTPQTKSSSPETLHQSRVMETLKTQYRVDQQVKFLHLQAEAESLLQQVKTLQRQRQASDEPVFAESSFR